MTRVRLVLVLLCALLPLAAAAVSERRTHEPHFETSTIPAALAGHTLRSEQRLDSEVLSMLEPRWYTMRAYADEAGRTVWVYIALYSGTEPGGAHDPTVCYPAQGWNATDAAEVEVALPGGARAAVKVLAASQGGREEQVMYWFQPARRWPARAAPEIILRMLDRLRGHPEYAFVRLSTPIDRFGGAPPEAAEERLSGVAAELAPWIRRAVSGDVD